MKGPVLLLTILNVVRVDCVGDIHLPVPAILYVRFLETAVQTSLLVNKVLKHNNC